MGANSWQTTALTATEHGRFGSTALGSEATLSPPRARPPGAAARPARDAAGMRFAIKTAPQHTTWDDMLAVWQAADEIDLFESAWTFDHFYPIFSDPTGPCLEGWIATAALAQATRRIRVGVLVTGNLYRHPAVLANMAATVDVISRRSSRARHRRRLEPAGVRRVRHRAAAAQGAVRPVRRGARGDHGLLTNTRPTSRAALPAHRRAL